MTNRQRPVVAIDGPAGAGKSTVARALAARLGFVLVDTGALYRGVALCARERGVDWSDGAALGGLAMSLNLSFRSTEQGEPLLRVDGVDRSADIRTPEISMGASQVSAHPQVREALLGLQRKLGADGGVVLEGRDIGTVVFPEAEVKFFLTASVGVRANRRHGDLSAGGSGQALDEVRAELERRDRQDSERAVAPLRPAEDAIHIDSSTLELDDVVAEMASHVPVGG